MKEHIHLALKTTWPPPAPEEHLEKASIFNECEHFRQQQLTIVSSLCSSYQGFISSSDRSGELPVPPDAGGTYWQPCNTDVDMYGRMSQ